MILKVPKNTGFIYGNFLRGLVIAGTPLWSIIAMEVGAKSSSLGYYNSTHTYLDVLDSKLEVLNNNVSFESPVVSLILDKDSDGNFSNADFKVTGLNCVPLPSIKVYIMKTLTSQSIAQNRQHLLSHTNMSQEHLDKAVTVLASSHEVCVDVCFKVEELDEFHDQLTINIPEFILPNVREVFK